MVIVKNYGYKIWQKLTSILSQGERPGQCDLQSVDDGNYLDIQPPSGETWEIAVIIHGADCEIYFSDGTNEQKFNTGTGADHIKDCGYIVTNSHYIRVKNVSGSTALFGYMAVRIHSSS